MSKKYVQLAIWNILFAVVAICLYLPYLLEAFDMAGFEWFKFVPKMLKDNYYNVLIYFGVFLLLWFICVNLFSVMHHANLPKVIFKLTIVLALLLPLMYVLALKTNWALNFWIKAIMPNIKMISYVSLIVCWGSFILGLIYNVARNHNANFHHIIEALVMCSLLTIMIVVNGWCGFGFNSSVKMYGVMVGLFSIYLPVTAIVLLICRKQRD